MDPVPRLRHRVQLGADVDGVRAAEGLAEALPQAVAEDPRQRADGEPVILRVHERAVEDDGGAGAGLAAEAELFLDPARAVPAAGDAQAEAAAIGGQPADVGRDEGAERGGLELSDEDEGEAARVGEALAVDLE